VFRGEPPPAPARTKGGGDTIFLIGLFAAILLFRVAAARGGMWGWRTGGWTSRRGGGFWGGGFGGGFGGGGSFGGGGGFGGFSGGGGSFGGGGASGSW
jgi:uncharacterized protein